jgi:hypothetical protein
MTARVSSAVSRVGVSFLLLTEPPRLARFVRSKHDATAEHERMSCSLSPHLAATSAKAKNMPAYYKPAELRDVFVNEALRRAEAWRAAGDMLMILHSDPAQARVIGERSEGWFFYLMVEAVRSIGMSLAESGELGYRIVVDRTTAFLARQKAMRPAHVAIAEDRPDPTLDGGYRKESRLVRAAIGLDRLLEVESRTVETARGA